MPRYIRPDRCTIQRRNGDFCDAPSAPTMPHPICARHAMELYQHMRSLVHADARDMVHEEYARFYGIPDYAEHQRRQRNTPDHRVYYVHVGGLIKIGTTGDLASRMRAYPPDSKLLATEPGGHDLEAERLAQFAHLKAQRREWFHPGAALIAHIEQLRQAA